jgi:G6PDH family F420-dependent oxidoreductase
MALIGYHCSHEQFPPSELLSHVTLAHRAGFRAAMCSDHFNPWSQRQGHSGFAWSWLGAAMHASPLPFGVVNAPGQRYHPAIVAQAGATLAEMFPGRFWLALGSGQLLNEHITADAWIPKKERQARLLECVEIIRKLCRGKPMFLQAQTSYADTDRAAREAVAQSGHRAWLRRDLHSPGRARSERLSAVFGEQVLPRIPQQRTARTPFRV